MITVNFIIGILIIIIIPFTVVIIYLQEFFFREWLLFRKLNYIKAGSHPNASSTIDDLFPELNLQVVDLSQYTVTAYQ